jgi:hypothetical protein
MSRWGGGPFSGPSLGLWCLVLLDTFLRMNNHPGNTTDPRPRRAERAPAPCTVTWDPLYPQAISCGHTTHQSRERS